MGFGDSMLWKRMAFGVSVRWQGIFGVSVWWRGMGIGDSMLSQEIAFDDGLL